MVRYPKCVIEASRRSGIAKGKLLQSYKRGIGAWRTSPQSVRSRTNPSKRGVPKSQRMSKEQWACARVNKLAKMKRRNGERGKKVRWGWGWGDG